MSSARRNDGIRQAVAARERGRAKVRSTTTTVTVASVVTAGALALALPGSSHTTSTSSIPAARAPPRPTRAPPVPAPPVPAPAVPAPPVPAAPRTPAPAPRIPVPAPPVRVPAPRTPAPAQLQLELRWLQLRLLTHFQLRRQPGHLGRLLMPSPAAEATDAEADASASWRALGTLVQLVVTDPAALPEARRLLEADLAAVDATCSRFREDSEIRSLTGGRQPRQPAAGRGHRRGAAGGQADRRRRGPDRRRGHVRGRVRP